MYNSKLINYFLNMKDETELGICIVTIFIDLSKWFYNWFIYLMETLLVLS
jgi:hypothetical protein